LAPRPSDLAPGGVYRAAAVTCGAGGLLHHRFTLTAWPKPDGGLFSVALSRGSPRVGVTDHPALRSPDLPRRPAKPRRRGRPASSPAASCQSRPCRLTSRGQDRKNARTRHEPGRRVRGRCLPSAERAPSARRSSTHARHDPGARCGGACAGANGRCRSATSGPPSRCRGNRLWSAMRRPGSCGTSPQAARAAPGTQVS